MIHPDTVLTRYMSKSKFLSLLNDGLYLSKVTKFKDELEGILPYFNKDNDSSLLNREKIRKSLDWVYVSCWYNDSIESNAMWELYGENNEAIAIQTSARKLQNLYLNKNREMQSYFDCVEYKNPDLETFEKHSPITVLTNFLANEGSPEVIYSALFSFYKHIAYKSENEIRLAVVDSNANINKENTNNGIILEVENTIELIDKVIVSPSSTEKFKNETQALLNSYKVSIEVSDSQIKLKS